MICSGPFLILSGENAATMCLHLIKVQFMFTASLWDHDTSIGLSKSTETELPVQTREHYVALLPGCYYVLLGMMVRELLI